MPHLHETYEYHLQLEPFGAFLRRERKAILLISCAFAAAMVAVVFLIPPAFFYSRIQTDPLNYWLKAKQLVEHGNTAARWAVNMRPFAYAAMPGVLRAPALLLSSEFDRQLRIMQLMNIPLLAGLGIMSAYVMSWPHPERRHAWIIAFSFAMLLLTPIWLANIFLPLVDAPYAFFTIATIILARAIICSSRRLRDQKLHIALFAVFFAIAFSLRFTAPAVIVFAGILARGRWARGNISPRMLLIAGAAAALLVLIMVAFNVQAIFGRYLPEPLFFLRRASKVGMVLNVFGVALPAQIIPAFHLGFAQTPVEPPFHIHFAESARDAVWLAVGLSISGLIAYGMWTTRRKLLAEAVYILLPLPLLMTMLPSTTRYMMSYQPFLLLFFYYGLVALGARANLDRIPLVHNRVAVIAIVVATISGIVGLRMLRSAGTAAPASRAIRITHAPQYVRDVSTAFGNLRSYLATLPRDSVLLVGQYGTAGRWTIISGFQYYRADSLLPEVARRIPVYVLAECGTQEQCQDAREFGLYTRYEIEKWGDFLYKPEYMYITPNANVQVFRLFPL